jgi:GDPmannose 4,6-dehydratase
MVKNYREAFGMFATNGILFNHESPRRGETFVTRKITRGIADVLAGHQKRIYLGNLDTMRDWGFAPEYVEAMWRMLQVHDADDFVLGTGESNSVRSFLMLSLEYVGIDLEWSGEGTEECGRVRSIGSNWSGLLNTGDIIVQIDPRYFRPVDLPALRADCSKAQRMLDWAPRVSFRDLVKIMIDHDLTIAGLQAPSHGFATLEQFGLGGLNRSDGGGVLHALRESQFRMNQERR